MFIVRFVRKDGKPDEEYYYHTQEELVKALIAREAMALQETEVA